VQLLEEEEEERIAKKERPRGKKRIGNCVLLEVHRRGEGRSV